MFGFAVTLPNLPYLAISLKIMLIYGRLSMVANKQNRDHAVPASLIADN